MTLNRPNPALYGDNEQLNFDPYQDDEDVEENIVEMGALKTIYHITSNIREDDAGESSSGRQEHGIPEENNRSSHNGSANGYTINGSANGVVTVQDSENDLPPRPTTAWTSPVWKYIPQPIKRLAQAVGTWAKGPVPPRPWSIRPFFPKIQTYPIRLRDRLFPKQRHRLWLLIGFYFCWLLCFVTILHQSAFTEEVPGYGVPVLIDGTATFWSAKNACGIDGSNCRPFNDSNLAFRCPASAVKTILLNPHAVGTQEINYQPLVIGGPSDPQNSVETAVYRGDSFICAAAIHAGFLTNGAGGCGVVAVVGEGVDYPSSNQHGVPSVGFDSNFPLSFKFLPGTRSECKDLRWPLTGVDVFFSAVLAIFTTSSAVFFSSTFGALYWHVALVSDPPSGSDYYTLVSIALGKFLPAAFVAYFYHRFVIRRTLGGLRAQIEKTILWLGPCWVGCLNNYTFDKIPIQRLTWHDLDQQPGAVVALVIIVLIVFVIALGQAWAIRIAGLMPRYLALYGVMLFCTLMLLAVPNMNLRIHHYFLAMFLLPGTGFQTRPSLVYQGLLVGLFINGIARWGFDSILQTSAELQGDAQIGNALPVISTPVVGANNSNITFDWGLIPWKYDTVSVLVNDVERHRTYDNETTGFTWTRDIDAHPEYFRFGYMYGSVTYDYTQAGTWEADGTWTPMKSGPSK